jgi:hypothetical protein
MRLIARAAMSGVTICTAVAPEAVLTGWAYGTGPLDKPPITSVVVLRR